MKKIFISRQLDEHSVFYKTLLANGLEAHGESLLSFEPVPFAQPPAADWVFFYSRTAAQFYLENTASPFAGGAKLAALGTGTAAFLAESGYTPHFVGDGDPVRTAAQFLAVARGRRVLFPRARESRLSIQRLLGGAVVSLDLVVYENVPRTDFSLPSFEVLVFTSPLNAATYFSKKAWKGEAVVAIGDTTAEALRQLGITAVHIAEQPTEEALAATVLGLLSGKKSGR